MSDNPFNILSSSEPVKAGTQAAEENKALDVKARIQALIQSSPIFLFMKGTTEFPQCGFSANSTAILNSLGRPYKTFDILTDMEIRQGVKDYSNWPTFPQLYIKGSLVGGNDIIVELFHSGELKEMIEQAS